MSTIVRAARLIDGTGSPPIDDAEVLIEEGRISAVGRTGSIPTGDRQVVNYPTATVIPGMIDLHVHFCYDTESPPGSRGPNRVAMMETGFRNARDWLEQGVTTARVLGTPFDIDVGLKELIVKKPELGPRLVTAGRMMTMTGGRKTDQDYMKEEVTGANEARRWTRVQMKEGADVIKLYSATLVEDFEDYLTRLLALPVGAPDPGRWASLTEEEIRAVVTEAHKVGRTVAAHTSPAFGIKLALRGGADTVEHGSQLDDECLELLLETGATLVPTLSVYHHEVEHGRELGIPARQMEYAHRSLEQAGRAVRLAHGAGVRIGTGTDGGCVRGMTFWTEPELLVNFGVPPLEALHSATGLAASCLGLAGTGVGTLEPGKWADMVVLSGDPSEDISNIRRVEVVYKGGEIVAGQAGRGGA